MELRELVKLKIEEAKEFCINDCYNTEVEFFERGTYPVDIIKEIINLGYTQEGISDGHCEKLILYFKKNEFCLTYEFETLNGIHKFKYMKLYD